MAGVCIFFLRLLSHGHLYGLGCVVMITSLFRDLFIINSIGLAERGNIMLTYQPPPYVPPTQLVQQGAG